MVWGKQCALYILCNKQTRNSHTVLQGELGNKACALSVKSVWVWSPSTGEAEVGSSRIARV